jgi:DNA-binding LytR/AlgR family response regulator
MQNLPQKTRALPHFVFRVFLRTYLSISNRTMNNDILFIRAKRALHKITVPDIIYIEAMDDYVSIHSEGQKALVARMTMSDMMEMLDPGKFVRVHRSYIVPVNRIESIASKKVTVQGQEIPLGNTYLGEVIKQFKKAL